MRERYRYEFYLPVAYNDGKPVETEKFDSVKHILEEKFNGISVHYIKISGEWKEPVSGKLFKDDNLKYEVTVDSEEDAFFLDLKEKLKSMFGQREVYMIRTAVESL